MAFFFDNYDTIIYIMGDRLLLHINWMWNVVFSYIFLGYLEFQVKVGIKC